ncbi:acyltransferase family protein [Dyadobacter sediminis]|uniref:Acyltransferase n=1 Tax=Dyadobacter sediminis TaxID=1493691 RepID=A0A5R9KDR3_9BACT|nr:acyltransferase family protein [Dyadobacter sediminis]TLU94295.1 acyltransferase [Dyadobacter sediminis]GGB92508.1 hypothetical protein GCM10011325_19940 [Dyadobacter sediminis]
MESKNVKLNFRYDINALRAIAILGVILFHYKIVFLSGGFAGVDVFFVISGYLMSKIIINSIDKNQFSFTDYFEKRLKRIVPALIFLILTLTVIGFFFYFPEDFKLNQKNAAASILFLSNVLYWKSSDYFAPASDTNILLHTWSLSVEWQFYLLYPAILLLLSRLVKNRRFLIAFFVASTLFILAASILFTNISPTASFYLLPSRSWEMMFGGIAFFSENLIKDVKWKKILAITGYLSILACFLLLDTMMPWPSVYTIFPVVATFLIIIANYNEFGAIRNTVVQFIGKISYSLYLWHWPVYVVAQYYGIGTNLQSVLLLSAISIVLGYLSFTYVESIKFATNRMILATMVFIFAGTASLSYFNSNDILYKDKTLQIEGYARTHKKELELQFNKDICHVSKMEDYDKEKCLCIVEGKKNILLIGDSHLGQLSQSFREHFANTNVHFLQATASGTLPTIRNYEGDDAMVRKLMHYIYFDFIPKNAGKIDGVVLSGSWAGKNNVDEESILFGIKEATQHLKKYNINTIIIGQTERYNVPYATIAARDYENNSMTMRRYLNSYAYELDNFLSRDLKSSYIRVINVKSIPKLSSKDEPYMADSHHLTKYGADLIVDKILSDPIAKEFFGIKKKSKKRKA